MQCDNYLPLLSGHLDSANSEIEERRLQKHLRACRHCRARLAELEANDLLLREPTPEPIASVKAIMERVGREPRRRGHRRVASWVAVAATAAVLALALFGDMPLPLRAEAENAAEQETPRAENEAAQYDMADGAATDAAVGTPVGGAATYSAVGTPVDGVATFGTVEDKSEAAELARDAAKRAVPTDEAAADIPVAFVHNAASPTAYPDLEPVSAESLIAEEGLSLNDGAVRLLTDLAESDEVSVDAYLAPYDTFSALVTEWVGQYTVKVSYPTAENAYTQGLVLNIIDSEE